MTTTTTIWTIDGPSPNFEREHAERVHWFSKIEPRGNWKNPIDCWIKTSDFAECNAAAEFFTGGGLEIVCASFGMIRVRGRGYYVNVGA